MEFILITVQPINNQGHPITQGLEGKQRTMAVSLDEIAGFITDGTGNQYRPVFKNKSLLSENRLQYVALKSDVKKYFSK